MRSTARAIVAGLVASLAMDLAQAGFAFAFERSRAPDDLDEETEAVASVVKRIAPYVPGTLVRNHPETTGRLVHYTFGSAFALGYLALVRVLPAAGIASGAGFGLALWFVSDVVLVPAIRFGRPWNQYSWGERANAVVSHLAYAMTLDRLMRVAPEA